ncbi:hypothetical protein QTG54_010167 [Skeletonema marinoi]|uniref:Uncharacterized protein n=1 Tax=Skeletonema marinoi TaxID=267567 RepID=A0AAD9D954_9STRA|nr:hypothetical protein QTG54_010167 [Skeletonema marinoi]
MRLTTALTYSLLVAGLPKRGQAAVSPATSNCVDQNFTDIIFYEPEGETDDICTANGGTSRVMGTVAGSDYTLCSFGNENACELGKLMSGECDKTNPSLISFCAESGGSMSLGGVEPLEFEKCTVGEMTCIEEDYYLNGGCDVTKEVEQPTEVPPDNDTCSNAAVISNDGPIGLELGTVQLIQWKVPLQTSGQQIRLVLYAGATRRRRMVRHQRSRRGDAPQSVLLKNGLYAIDHQFNTRGMPINVFMRKSKRWKG